MERKISVKQTREPICTCNGCGAQNYESQYGNGKKTVDVLFEVKIGVFSSRLCPDCLKALMLDASTALYELSSKKE